MISHDADTTDRLARLETKVDRLTEDLTKAMYTQQTIIESLRGYKGFIGGVAFIISAVWAFVGLVWTNFGEHIRPPT